jgi:hypothetical protein
MHKGDNRKYENALEFLKKVCKTSSQLVHGETKPIPYIIKPYLIRGSFTLMTGKIGTMKSLFSLHLAGIAAEKGENVIYIDKENGIHQIESRAKLLGLPPVDNLLYWSDRPGLELDEQPPTFEKLAIYREIVKDLDQPILMFDTLNRFGGSGVDENSVKDTTTKLTNPLIQLCRRYGATLWVIHQAGKSSMDSGFTRSYRGSSEIGGACDQGFQIIDYKQLDPDQASFTIDCFKSRWRSFSPIRMCFDTGEFHEVPKQVADAMELVAIKQSMWKYLEKFPSGCRKQEITQALKSKSLGNFSGVAVEYVLDHCGKNSWTKTVGPRNSNVYRYIPKI